ncbi:MAG: hypothetical protein SOX40_00915, partial [Bacteroidaceae bacterium]|nr:hypothetical protein [Bacteroidaceae bacterium]
ENNLTGKSPAKTTIPFSTITCQHQLKMTLLPSTMNTWVKNILTQYYFEQEKAQSPILQGFGQYM